MNETLFIDCSFTKPKPAAVKASHYAAVIGYISHDPAKDLSAQQARAYLEQGLPVAFVFETTAGRAQGGRSAGASDRTFAEQESKRRGYPAGCPIFYAVDGDYDPKTVVPYFAAVSDGAIHPVGVYGSARVVDAVLKAGAAKIGWQTAAWSGTAVSKLAHLYQRSGKTVAPIAGVKGSAYDENVVLKRVAFWGGYLSPPTGPATHSGWSVPVAAALRLVTRRANRKTKPLTPRARALAVAAVQALTHALNVK